MAKMNSRTYYTINLKGLRWNKKRRYNLSENYKKSKKRDADTHYTVGYYLINVMHKLYC